MAKLAGAPGTGNDRAVTQGTGDRKAGAWEGEFSSA
jgi:hypothetical protein